MATDIIARGMANQALTQVEGIINGELKLSQYGAKVHATYDVTTNILTLELQNYRGEVLDSTNVMIAGGGSGFAYKLVKGEYAAATNEIILTLADGEQVAFPLDALTEQYQPLLTFDEMPKPDSTNPVESNGIYKMIDSIVKGQIWLEDNGKGDLEVKTVMTYKLAVAGDDDGNIILV